MENTSTSSPLLSMGIGQILPALKVVSEAIFHRGELVALEVSQISQYALSLVVTALLSVVMILLAGFAGTFMVAALVWDRPDRGLILGLLALGQLIAAAVLGYLTVARFRKWEPLRETANQLRADHDCIQSILTPSGETSKDHARP